MTPAVTESFRFANRLWWEGMNSKSMFTAVSAVVLLMASAAGVFGAQGNYVGIEVEKLADDDTTNKVYVEKFGHDASGAVLILVPGTGGGAGSLIPIARDIVANVDGLQVWTFDRRGQNLEDQSGFKLGDPSAAAEYYFGGAYRGTVASLPVAAEWGLATQMDDLKAVVTAAAEGGRKVILGGHSSGAQQAIIYAAWDFPSGAGYKDLSGLVLIDGGLFSYGGLPEVTGEVARTELEAIRAGSVFADNFGAGQPELSSIFFELAASYAAAEPDSDSALQVMPQFAPTGPAFRLTNAAYLGYFVDADTAPFVKDIRVRAGELSPDDGETRGWVDGEVTPIAHLADTWSHTQADAFDWYWPKRLTLDIRAAVPLFPNEGAEVLGLQMTHTADIALPLYAMQTELNDGDVLRAAKKLISASKIAEQNVVLVDASDTMSHLDPITAPFSSNVFTQTVIGFLRTIVATTP